MRGEPMFRWDPDHVTRVGVLPRDGDEVTWFEADPAYVNHTWNAWEEDGEIVFSGSRIDGADYATSAMEREGADADPGMPTRYRVDPVAGTVKAEQFDDLGGDFPRINDAYAGVRSRYLYQVAFRGVPDVVGHFDTVVKYDDQAGTRTDWHAGAGQLVGEAVFAPDPEGRAEDDGWLLATVTDRATGATDVAVLEAGDVAAGPIARIHLPRRLPFGFHANWFAA
jgi:carotenoid cleavage dioxygenase